MKLTGEEDRIVVTAGHIIAEPQWTHWLCHKCGVPRKLAVGVDIPERLDKRHRLNSTWIRLRIDLECGHQALYQGDACAPVVEG